MIEKDRVEHSEKRAENGNVRLKVELGNVNKRFVEINLHCAISD